MGREIRRVPPYWEHPKGSTSNSGHYQPLHDRVYEAAIVEWRDGKSRWLNGTHPDLVKYEFTKNSSWQEWSGPPPDPDDYRPDFGDTATWYQVYETVTEGTPVTPPFKTKSELIEYLTTNGDFWDQSRVRDGRMEPPSAWSRESAVAFVAAEWAPSMIVSSKDGIQLPRDAHDEERNDA